jgi:plastocyanin
LRSVTTARGCVKSVGVALLLALWGSLNALGQTVTVIGRVELVEGAKHPKDRSPSPTVVWLTPLSSTGADSAAAVKPVDSPPRLIQKNKSFSPHLLVVPVGSAVEFPNRDPFFHNVFSLFEGKRFDLGLYEAGSARLVHFDQPGISYIFCNIHPEMSAVVIALNTRWYTLSDSAGQLSIPDVPYGRYVLHAWNEHALPEALQSITREVTISPDTPSLGLVRLTANPDAAVAHKNKYGRDYDQPSPSSPIYPQQ